MIQKIKCWLGFHKYEIKRDYNVKGFAVPINEIVAKYGCDLSEVQIREVAKFYFGGYRSRVCCASCPKVLYSFDEVYIDAFRGMTK